MLLALESTEATIATSPSALVSFSLPTSTPSLSNGGEGLGGGGGGENTAIIAAIVSAIVALIIITTVTIVLMAVLTLWKRTPSQQADGITDTSKDNNLVYGKQYNTGICYVRYTMYISIHIPVDICMQILLFMWTRMLPITKEYNCSRMYAILPHPAVWRMNQGQYDV